VQVTATLSTGYFIDQAVRGDRNQQERAIVVLRWFRYSAETDRIVLAYDRARTPQKRRALARVYRRITGRDIRARLRLLQD
jgi:hypothetical protein